MKKPMLGIGILLIFFLWGTSSGMAETHKKLTVTDLENRRVEAPANPGRILCLGPGAPPDLLPEGDGQSRRRGKL